MGGQEEFCHGATSNVGFQRLPQGGPMERELRSLAFLIFRHPANRMYAADYAALTCVAQSCDSACVERGKEAVSRRKFGAYTQEFGPFPCFCFGIIHGGHHQSG